MDWNSLAEFVGRFGFPMVLCILLCYYIKMLVDKFQAQMEKQSELRFEEQKQHKEEMLQVMEIVNNNTLALQELKDRLSLRKEE